MVGAAAGTLATYFGQMGTGFFGLIQFDTYSLFSTGSLALVAFLGDPCLGFLPGARKSGAG